MQIDERKTRTERIIDAAGRIMTAGRTAPKARGVDLIEIIALTGDEKTKLADTLSARSEPTGHAFFNRDALNVMQADAVILIGTRRQVMGLNCGYCGFPTCEKNEAAGKNIPCVMNSADLGIAIGSMVSMAADLRVDTRVMFSAGYAAKYAGFLTDCTSVFAIPVGISTKNPFFDRPTAK